jgi:uncharacterized RDD family membrane protein YckC
VARSTGSPAGSPSTGEDAQDAYPGRRFGFPRSGPGSIAGIGRRVAQISIDIALSWLAADAFAFHYVEGVRQPYPWASVLVYVAECVVLLVLGGQTAGMRLTGLRVVRLDGRPAGPVAALVRTLLTLLLIPILMLDRDLRGVHDRAVGVAVVRTR